MAETGSLITIVRLYVLSRLYATILYATGGYHQQFRLNILSFVVTSDTDDQAFLRINYRPPTAVKARHRSLFGVSPRSARRDEHHLCSRS